MRAPQTQEVTPWPTQALTQEATPYWTPPVYMFDDPRDASVDGSRRHTRIPARHYLSLLAPSSVGTPLTAPAELYTNWMLREGVRHTTRTDPRAPRHTMYPPPLTPWSVG
ncbi:hypothetical protein DFH09DRAFT_1362194 [Mycena vulgaris]|nr:hypothetical protein DFH09DRAFT_1362194 [Mycena vulgaris]